ncbi:MAG: ABC transporter ATP-binding protein, partial [Planctomycetota bacterium]
MSGFFEKDDLKEKAYDFRLLKRLFPYLKPHIYLALAGFFLGLMASLLRLSVPLLQGIVVRDLTPHHLKGGILDQAWILLGGSPKSPIGSLIPTICLLFGLVITGRFLVEVVQLYILQVFGQKVIYQIRVDLFDHLLHLSVDYFQKNPVGRLVTRISNDIESLSEFVSNGLTDLTRHFFTVLSISIALPIISWHLGWIALAFLPLVVLTSLIFRYFARIAYRELRKHIALLNTFLSENITGMPIIHAFSREEVQRNRFEEINQKLTQRYIRSIQTWALYSPTVNLLEGLTLATILYFGYYYATGGTINIATLSVFVWLINSYYEPIRHMAEKYNLLQSALAACERIFKVMDTQKDKALDTSFSITESIPTSGDITLEHVYFSYQKDQWVLKDIHFHIQEGETLALVGHTGAGKSSLIKLLLRFYDPQRGRILVDGLPLHSLPAKLWRRHLAVVPQDVFLFAGSILENIRLWDSSISLEQVESACRLVQAHDFISKLEKGYHTVLEEGAKNLSAGERQLLSFARALAHQPKILILDEATALIDTDTEQKLQKAIENLIRGRTTIVIAHRLSTIRNADKIVVLDKGEVVEMGTHNEL